jgi:hypothetical protein
MPGMGFRIGRLILVALFALALALGTRSALSAPPEAEPSITIVLGPRHGHAVPERTGYTHSGGGNIDIAQPGPDVVLVTMSGAVMAGGHPCKDSSAILRFELDQPFEIRLADPKLRRGRLTLEARVLGSLRGSVSCCGAGGCGSAEMSGALAAVSADAGEVAALEVPAHSVAGSEALAINDHAGPVSGPVTAGRYALHQTFVLNAAHSRALLPSTLASAEFAPESALDPLWLGTRDAFHGVVKKDFGFQLSLKVTPDLTPAGN